MDKDKMIDDIVAMLDKGVSSGKGHINVKVDEMQNTEKQVINGCAECSSNPTACSVPTEFFEDEED